MYADKFMRSCMWGSSLPACIISPFKIEDRILGGRGVPISCPIVAPQKDLWYPILAEGRHRRAESRSYTCAFNRRVTMRPRTCGAIKILTSSNVNLKSPPNLRGRGRRDLQRASTPTFRTSTPSRRRAKVNFVVVRTLRTGLVWSCPSSRNARNRLQPSNKQCYQTIFLLNTSYQFSFNDKIVWFFIA